jgi:hypothetical protein
LKVSQDLKNTAGDFWCIEEPSVKSTRILRLVHNTQIAGPEQKPRADIRELLGTQGSMIFETRARQRRHTHALAKVAQYVFGKGAERKQMSLACCL